MGNLTRTTVSMIMMENDDDGVLLESDIQQVEFGISNLTINTGEVLSSDSLDSPPSVQMDWGFNSAEPVINLYDPALNEGNVSVPSETSELPCSGIAAVMSE